MFDTLKKLVTQLKQELALYQLILKHPQTPRKAKFFLGLAIGYLLFPFDLIPDFIPILGQLDELVIVPLLFYIALKWVPEAIVEECRTRLKLDK